MNPWLRRILIWLVLSVALSLFIISRLPSQRQLARKMSHAETAVPVSADPVPALKAPAPSPGVAVVAVNSPSPNPSASPAPTKAERAKELKLMLALIDEDPRDTRVCNQLGQSAAGARLAQAPAAEEHYSFEDLFGADRSDSLLEAYRMPARAIFQEPAVSDLIREVGSYGAEIDAKSETEREGFLSKVGFYARVARAGATLVANRRKYEELGDRATHLSVIAKMAMANPKLRDDSRIMDFCRKIQGDDSPPTPENLRAERQELLSFLESAGMKPKDVDFDPEEWTKFSVKQTGGQLSISLSGKDEPKK